MGGFIAQLLPIGGGRLAPRTLAGVGGPGGAAAGKIAGRLATYIFAMGAGSVLSSVRSGGDVAARKQQLQ